MSAICVISRNPRRNVRCVASRHDASSALPSSSPSSPLFALSLRGTTCHGERGIAAVVVVMTCCAYQTSETCITDGTQLYILFPASFPLYFRQSLTRSHRHLQSLICVMYARFERCTLPMVCAGRGWKCDHSRLVSTKMPSSPMSAYLRYG